MRISSASSLPILYKALKAQHTSSAEQCSCDRGTTVGVEVMG